MSIESRLAHLSKNELMALVRRMVERHEDLELLVELAATGPGRSVDTERIRRQVRQAFGNTGFGWRASFALAGDLGHIVQAGDDLAEQGKWREAATVYRTTLEGIREDYETIHDEESEVGLVARECAEKLASCLPEIDEAMERESFLRTLVDTFSWDVNLGGFGISDGIDEAVLKQATAEERRLVAGWIREEMPPGNPEKDDFSTHWRRQAYGAFLLQVEKDDLAPDTYLRICRETGRWRDVIVRLLERGRVDEAVGESAHIPDDDLLFVTGAFAQHGHSDRVEPVVRERAQTSEARRFLPWLREQAEQRGDHAEALALAEQLFWDRPAVEHYAEVKRLALQLGRWDPVRAAVEGGLVEASNYVFLTQMHLFEEEIGMALQRLAQARQETGRAAAWYYAGLDQLALQVARAAEKSHPLEAVRLYLEDAERQIHHRDRRHYREAAGLLEKVRDLYRSLDREEDWLRCIERVRTGYRNLPALKDELKKAGL